MRAYPLTLTPQRDAWSTGEARLLDKLVLLCEQNEPLVNLRGLDRTVQVLLYDPAYGPGEYVHVLHTDALRGDDARADELRVFRKTHPANLLVATISLNRDRPVTLRLPPGKPPHFPPRP